MFAETKSLKASMTPNAVSTVEKISLCKILRSFSVPSSITMNSNFENILVGVKILSNKTSRTGADTNFVLNHRIPKIR